MVRHLRGPRPVRLPLPSAEGRRRHLLEEGLHVRAPLFHLLQRGHPSVPTAEDGNPPGSGQSDEGRRPFNQLITGVFCFFVLSSVSDPDSGVFWIRIRDPDPDLGA